MSIDVAREVIERWVAAFNARDVEGEIAAFNFPHVRLANGRFETIEGPDTLRTRHERSTAGLQAEGWHHTNLDTIEAVQSGPDKVHFTLRYTRCRADGTPYDTFDSLWIVTDQDGHWGVQFRSSYLSARGNG
jgi:hypothetical protein